MVMVHFQVQVGLKSELTLGNSHFGNCVFHFQVQVGLKSELTLGNSHFGKMFHVLDACVCYELHV